MTPQMVCACTYFEQPHVDVPADVFTQNLPSEENTLQPYAEARAFDEDRGIHQRNFHL